MSSQQFTCVVSQSVNDASQLLTEIIAGRTPFYGEARLPDKVALANTSGQVTLRFETPSSVEFEFFDALVEKLKALSGVEFKARLFDSSSGGTHVWQVPEESALELDDKNVVFLGDMEEDIDEMLEIAEGFCEVQEALDDDTEVVVLGHNVADAVRNEIETRQLAVMSEAEFWEYIEDLPG